VGKNLGALHQGRSNCEPPRLVSRQLRLVEISQAPFEAPEADPVIARAVDLAILDGIGDVRVAPQVIFLVNVD
jgi:hypothetical protein